MFDHNPFRAVNESFFKTREEAIVHWNLVHLGDGKYQHATKTGHIFDEEDLNHMQKYGVMRDTSIPSDEYEKKHKQLRKKIKMHENNSFENIKNYLRSYYTNISEGWNDAIEDATGFTWIDKGHHQYDEKHDPDGHGHHFYNEKTGEKMSQDEVMKLYDSMKNRNKEDAAAGPNPTDWDARPIGKQSHRYEKVEHKGYEVEELNEIEGRRRPYKRPTTTEFLARLKKQKEEEEKKSNVARDKEKIKKEDSKLGEGLFHKDSDRLLREHIRAEYEERGIYPTSKEIQETFNIVMDLIEKRKSYEQRTASLMLRRGASGKEVKDTVGRKRTPEGKSGNAILRKAREDAELQGIMQNHFTDDNDEPIVPRIQDHLARRGKKTKISPSSPARKQSEVEVDTRFLMGQGFSPSHLRRIMTDSGR